jgi:hypothetical protein|tara:strand:- start:7543 stop:7791 length:249 start_codon:yes stop_codon:yes gene_type:complete
MKQTFKEKKDTPFSQGFRVFRKGKLIPNTKMLMGNPFYPQSRSFKEWERGFTVAYYRNLERLDEQSEKTSRESFQNKGERNG